MSLRKFLFMIHLAALPCLFAESNYQGATVSPEEDQAILENVEANEQDIINFLSRVILRIKQEMDATRPNKEAVLLSDVYENMYNACKAKYFRKQMLEILKKKGLTKGILLREDFLANYIQNLLIVFLQEEDDDE